MPIAHTIYEFAPIYNFVRDFPLKACNSFCIIAVQILSGVFSSFWSSVRSCPGMFSFPRPFPTICYTI